MAGRDRKSAVGATRLAFDTINLRAGATGVLFLADTALRAVAYAPLYLLLTRRQSHIPEVYYIAASLILIVLFVMPSRAYVHAVLRHNIGGTRYSPIIGDDGARTGLRPICVNADAKGVYPDYWRCLRFSLIRCGIGLLWGLPCAALTAAWCYGFWSLNYNEFLPILLKISRFFGGKYYDLGTAIWMIAILLTGALFLFGWQRGRVSDYMRIVGRTDRRALTIAAEVRKANGRRLTRHALSQIPYMLPFLIACAAVLIGYINASVEWSPSLTNNALKLMTLLRAPLTGETRTTLLLLLVFLYAPLAFFRRMRSAALVYTLFSERAERRKEASHAA